MSPGGPVDRDAAATVTREVAAVKFDVRFGAVWLRDGHNISDSTFELPATRLSIDGIRSSVGQVATALFTGEVRTAVLTLAQYGRVVSADFRKC